MSSEIPLRNPTTGALRPPSVLDSNTKIDGTLEDARDGFKHWRRSALTERAERLQKAAASLRREASSLATLMAKEMGKPLAQGRAEVEKCAWVCDYYAAHGPGFLADQPVSSTADETFICCQPLGVIFAIMPWNFPCWQVFRAAAPILMAGNAFLLKHAPNVPECSRAIVRIMQEAGFPKGVFSETVASHQAATRIIADERIAGVTLTGSTQAGRSVASAAGQHIKKSLLELGGSDPYLILEDAPMELALDCCATSRMLNNGQTCISAKRFIVVESQYEAFIEGLRARLSLQSYGDPEDASSLQGPMARHDLRDALAGQVMRSLQQGARCVLGGATPDAPGAFYPATILCDVTPGMAAFDEEVFGPVAAVCKVHDADEAVALANASAYGLGAAVFTQDLERGKRIARDQLEAGCCVVNDFVKSDPRVPFGGIRSSGYGRELGQSGILEFTNLKTVALNRPSIPDR